MYINVALIKLYAGSSIHLWRDFRPDLHSISFYISNTSMTWPTIQPHITVELVISSMLHHYYYCHHYHSYHYNDPNPLYLCILQVSLIVSGVKWQAWHSAAMETKQEPSAVWSQGANTDSGNPTQVCCTVWIALLESNTCNSLHQSTLEFILWTHSPDQETHLCPLN